MKSSNMSDLAKISASFPKFDLVNTSSEYWEESNIFIFFFPIQVNMILKTIFSIQAKWDQGAKSYYIII